MATTKTKPESEELFDGSDYDDPRLALPYVDEKPVAKISIRFSATIDLDRMNPQHVELFRRFTLGHKIVLQDVAGIVLNKPARQVRDKEGYVSDVAQTAVFSVESIGGIGAPAAPEPAAAGDGEGEGEGEGGDE